VCQILKITKPTTPNRLWWCLSLTDWTCMSKCISLPSVHIHACSDLKTQVLHCSADENVHKHFTLQHKYSCRSNSSRCIFTLIAQHTEKDKNNHVLYLSCFLFSAKHWYTPVLCSTVVNKGAVFVGINAKTQSWITNVVCCSSFYYLMHLLYIEAKYFL
jgi:hypothetical protein